MRADDILAKIGDTPLLRLRRIKPSSSSVEIYAKAEWFNPSGSVKDRAIYRIIREGEKFGELTKKKTILDATSGNAGISYAMIAAALGYKVHLTLPLNANIERKRTLQALGARLTLTNPLEGSDGAILNARELAEKNPDMYFYGDQYNNPANWRAHYETTGLEIIKQTDGKVTHFVSGTGTGGTIMGAGRKLKDYSSQIKVTAVEPDSPLHGIEGLKHMSSSIVPGIYDQKFADNTIQVATEEAQKMVIRLAREEGLLVGPSSGAAIVGALRLAAKLQKGLLVTILPDGAEKYLSERFWEEFAH
ncbi:MAG TPA: cysteine synthase family protein [Candidatus Bathyarchaeia archaeon]|nr:cysteine synthase family protein [Candidatus Bathyarchaeia archaeon]